MYENNYILLISRHRCQCLYLISRVNTDLSVWEFTSESFQHTAPTGKSPHCNILFFPCKNTALKWREHTCSECLLRTGNSTRQQKQDAQPANVLKFQFPPCELPGVCECTSESLTLEFLIYNINLKTLLGGCGRDWSQPTGGARQAQATAAHFCEW